MAQRIRIPTNPENSKLGLTLVLASSMVLIIYLVVTHRYVVEYESVEINADKRVHFKLIENPATKEKIVGNR